MPSKNLFIQLTETDISALKALHSAYLLKLGAGLKYSGFLTREGNHFILQDIISNIYDHIQDASLSDSTNPFIVKCSLRLSEALGVNFFHKMELKNILLKQLDLSSVPSNVWMEKCTLAQVSSYLIQKNELSNFQANFGGNALYIVEEKFRKLIEAENEVSTPRPLSQWLNVVWGYMLRNNLVVGSSIAFIKYDPILYFFQVTSLHKNQIISKLLKWLKAL